MKKKWRKYQEAWEVKNVAFLLHYCRGLGNCNNNQIRMDQIYNSFYIQEAEFESSGQDDFFQAWDAEKPLSEGCQVQNFKNIQINPPATQSTFYNKTTTSRLDQFTTQRKENPVQTIIYLRESEEKILKQKSQRRCNQIETSIYCLEKKVKTHKGESQETVNLNKYYGNCLKDYLQALSACHLVEASQKNKYGELLKNNEIASLKMQGTLAENCEKYVKSPHIINRLFTSSKMNFNNKIVTIKYMQGLVNKVTSRDTHPRSWKNDKD